MYELQVKPNYKISFSIVCCLLSIACFSHAQTNVKDSTLTFSMARFSYAFQLPGENLAKRFGNNSNTGLDFSIKTKRNFIFGANGSLLFGNQINENGILDSLKNSSGFIINQNGIPSTVRLFERGFIVSLYFGKMFHVLAPNPNSGIVIYGGTSYMYHKIKINDIGHQAPQLTDGYLKGYDRLSAGFGLHEFIGYFYLGNSRIINFFGGIELIQGFTKSLRGYNYDLRQPDTASRKDFFYGLRVGWILPLYKALPQQFYYY
ncbi:MAG: hypothetical protein HY840_09910 [Bacteroidetes bacterium]|nr:hypothetical protein [Bacteroidota bacterium]